MEIPDRKPDIHVLGFQLWIHGREFPDGKEFWDNWLEVTVAYSSEKRDAVSVSGPIIHISELVELKEGLQEIITLSKSQYKLSPVEQYFEIEITKKHENDIRMKIVLFSDPEYKKYQYKVNIDMTHIQSLLEQLERIIQSYPLRDES